MNGIDYEDLMKALQDMTPDNVIKLEDAVNTRSWLAVGLLIEDALNNHARGGAK